METKAIIYDADGVLIHSEMFSVQLEKDYGISSDKLMPFFKGAFKDCLIGKADLKVELEKVIADWGWTKSVDELLEYWFNSENHVDERIIESIKVLRGKGIICVLGTNQEQHRVDFMLSTMNFGEIFNHVYSSAEIGFKKPTVEFYQYIINSLKLNPEEIMYFDDSQENVDAAKTLGVNAFFFDGIENYHKLISEI